MSVCVCVAGRTVTVKMTRGAEIRTKLIERRDAMSVFTSIRIPIRRCPSQLKASTMMYSSVCTFSFTAMHATYANKPQTYTTHTHTRTGTRTNNVKDQTIARSAGTEPAVVHSSSSSSIKCRYYSLLR